MRRRAPWSITRSTPNCCAVRNVTEEAHRNAPPTIRLEEELNGIALLNDGDVVGAINEALRPALRAVYEGGDRAMEIAHWVRRALPRLHRRVRRTQGAMSLLLASDSLLGSRPLTKTPDADVSADTLAWILSAAALLTRFRLGVELLERGLRFVVPTPDSPAIELPRTDPALLELGWTRGRRRVKKLVEAEAGRTVDLEEKSPRSLSGRWPATKSSSSASRPKTSPVAAQAASSQTPLDFDHDVFFSYAHLDDVALEEGATGLGFRLAQCAERASRLNSWRDSHLAGSEAADDILLALDRPKLPRSATFIAVMSPRYVKSEWCHRELEAFVMASATRGGVGLVTSPACSRF